MKMTKKVLAMALCLVMVLSMATTAFAAAGHNHTLTINNSIEGYTYVAYQIFEGVLGADGVLSDIKWGSGVDGDALLTELKKLDAYKDCTNAKQVAAVLAGYKTVEYPTDHPDLVAFAELAAKYLTTTVAGTSSYADDKYTISGLDDGYYLVKNTAVPEGGTDTTYTRYILEVVRNVSVAHKGDFPHVYKDIDTDGDLATTNDRASVNNKSIGDKETYVIRGTIPSNIDYYETYFYKFHDTLSKGLTYDGNMKVTVNNVDVTDKFTINSSAVTDGTYITAGINDLFSLESIVGQITSATEVVVTYTATLNEHAVVARLSNPNKVYLEYSNDPNNDGAGSVGTNPTGKTPEKRVDTYTTELYVHKVDGQGNALIGAEFTLTGAGVKTMVITKEVYRLAGEGETGKYYKLKDGTYTATAPVYDNPDTTEVNEDTAHGYAEPVTPAYILDEVTEVKTAPNQETGISATVDAQGFVRFTGLGAGVYTLTETVTPSGYNTIEPITFEIKFDANTKEFSCPSDLNYPGNNLILDSVLDPANLDAFYAEIVNTAGTVLPSTGGIGTTLFYVFGSLLFIGAGVLLVTKKRMAA